MIQFRNVSFSYRDHMVFEDLNFSLGDFKSTAILGLNGEGKTTFLKLLLSLLKPEKGKILVNDEDIQKLSDQKRAQLFSYVPQESDDSLNMSVIDFICMGKISQRSFFLGPDENEKQDALKLLKQLNCEALSQRDISALSFGQKRLIYLARAIYQDAKILVMDEPVASLDLLKQHDLLSYLKRHLEGNDKQLIFSIHDPCLAYAYADTFLFFKGHELFDIVKKTDPGHEEKLTRDIASLYENKVSVFLEYGKISLELLNH